MGKDLYEKQEFEKIEYTGTPEDEAVKVKEDNSSSTSDGSEFRQKVSNSDGVVGINNEELLKASQNVEAIINASTGSILNQYDGDMMARDAITKHYEHGINNERSLQNMFMLAYMKDGNPNHLALLDQSVTREEKLSRAVIPQRWASSVLKNSANESSERIRLANTVKHKAIAAYKLGEDLMQLTGARGSLGSAFLANVQGMQYLNLSPEDKSKTAQELLATQNELADMESYIKLGELWNDAKDKGNQELANSIGVTMKKKWKTRFTNDKDVI